MAVKTMKLCGKCAALLEDGYKVLGEGYELQKVATQVNMKITCEHCGRRRYGAVYQLGRKKMRGVAGNA